MIPIEARWLSMHAAYACRHAGACCSAGWPIPLESFRASHLQAAIDAGRIAAPSAWLMLPPDRPPGVAGVLVHGADRRCAFRRGQRCDIHAALGPGALPTACQHFPRIVLTDARGVSVTLSHYCPTAADLLFDTSLPLAIVNGPPPLPDGLLPEGLDAREAWPPLLTPGTLMDHESYGMFEAHMVATFDRLEPEAALARLDGDVEALEAWTVEDGPLVDAVRATTAMRRSRVTRRSTTDATARTALFDCVRGAVPAPLTWPAAPADIDDVWHERVAGRWPSHSRLVSRYLAARAFASWTAYQANALAVVVQSLRAALAVLEVETARACGEARRDLDARLLREAVRQSDLLVVHYADSQALADTLSC
jgi:hypothetical protein